MRQILDIVREMLQIVKSYEYILLSKIIHEDCEHRIPTTFHVQGVNHNYLIAAQRRQASFMKFNGIAAQVTTVLLVVWSFSISMLTKFS